MRRVLTRALALLFTVLAFLFSSGTVEGVERGASRLLPPEPVRGAAPEHGREHAPSLRRYVHRCVRRMLRPRFRRFASAIATTILQESRRFSFDPLLILAVIEQESRFHPAARGTSGELGLMQLKPSTARWLSRKFSFTWKGRRSLLDPSINIRFGTAYLALLRERFESRTQLYLAAYNSGVSAILRAISARELPQAYVAGVMSRYYRHSAGLSLART